jgi:hypothetical protein
MSSARLLVRTTHRGAFLQLTQTSLLILLRDLLP